MSEIVHYFSLIAVLATAKPYTTRSQVSPLDKSIISGLLGDVFRLCEDIAVLSID